MFRGFRVLRVASARGTCSIAPHPDLPNVNVCTLGAFRHGKSTLTSALTRLGRDSHGWVQLLAPQDLDKTASERAAGHGQHATHVEWAANKCRFSHSDLPGNPAYIRNVVNHLFCIDAAILVVDTANGVVPDTRLYYRLAKHAGVRRVVTFVNDTTDTTDADKIDTFDLVRADLSEFMNNEEMSRVTFGSALKASCGEATAMAAVQQLSAHLDDEAVRKDRKPDSGLIFPLEQVGNIPMRGMFVAGRVREGSMKVGSLLTAHHEGKQCKVNVRDLEVFKRKCPLLSAGDRGGAFIKLKLDIDLGRGGLLTSEKPPADFFSSNTWKVGLTGDNADIVKGHVSVFYSTAMDGSVSVTPTDTSSDFILTFRFPFLARIGDPIIIRHGGTFCLANLKEPIKANTS